MHNPLEFLWGQRINVAPIDSSYELWRQDDNGNKFIVSLGSEEDMDALLEQFESRSHKQTYWVQTEGTP